MKRETLAVPTRREFLLNSSALAAAMALAPFPTFAAPSLPAWRTVGLDQISAETFAEQVNTRFVVREREGRAVSLLLAGVEPAGLSGAAANPAATNHQEQFSLLFAGADSQRLEQNTYTFEHASLGRFEMFIVPVGRPVSGCRVYEAVFDRPAPPGRGHTRDARRNAAQ